MKVGSNSSSIAWTPAKKIDAVTFVPEDPPVGLLKVHVGVVALEVPRPGLRLQSLAVIQGGEGDLIGVDRHGRRRGRRRRWRVRLIARQLAATGRVRPVSLVIVVRLLLLLLLQAARLPGRLFAALGRSSRRSRRRARLVAAAAAVAGLAVERVIRRVDVAACRAELLLLLRWRRGRQSVVTVPRRAVDHAVVLADEETVDGAVGDGAVLEVHVVAVEGSEALGAVVVVGVVARGALALLLLAGQHELLEGYEALELLGPLVARASDSEMAAVFSK